MLTIRSLRPEWKGQKKWLVFNPCCHHSAEPDISRQTSQFTECDTVWISAGVRLEKDFLPIPASHLKNPIWSMKFYSPILPLAAALENYLLFETYFYMSNNLQKPTMNKKIKKNIMMYWKSWGPRFLAVGPLDFVLCELHKWFMIKLFHLAASPNFPAVNDISLCYYWVCSYCPVKWKSNLWKSQVSVTFNTEFCLRQN